MSDLDQPCRRCREGLHEACDEFTCGCLAFHPDDTLVMRGFKDLKQKLHPEREAWTFGGWKRP